MRSALTLRGTVTDFYRKFPDKYAGATQGLSFIEHGAYNLMLDYLYRTERPLPLKITYVYKVLGAKTAAERAAVQYILKEYFHRTRNGYTQKKFGEELTFVNSRRLASRENGKKGGRPPKPKETQQVSHNKPTETHQVIVGSYARENLEKPDSKTLRPLDIKTSQDQVVEVVDREETATAIKAIFKVIESDPFGSQKFREAFLVESKNGATSWVDVMEHTILYCNARKITVPGRFYEIKHALEKLDAPQSFKRTPL